MNFSDKKFIVKYFCWLLATIYFYKELFSRKYFNNEFFPNYGISEEYGMEFNGFCIWSKVIDAVKSGEHVILTAIHIHCVVFVNTLQSCPCHCSFSPDYADA